MCGGNDYDDDDDNGYKYVRAHTGTVPACMSLLDKHPRNF